MAVPTIVNTRCTSARLRDVYGLLNSQQPAATPTFSPAAGTYNSSQSVTLSDTTSEPRLLHDERDNADDIFDALQ
jgi:hypothetical protein